MVTLQAQWMIVMASIRKKNDKWQVQIRRDGFGQTSKTFLKKTDAQEWARMMEAKADRQDLPTDRRTLSTYVLGDLVDRYRSEIVSQKKSKDVETIIMTAFRRHKLCKKKLSAITAEDWMEYRDCRLRTITPKSLKRQLSPIRHMFNVAIEDWGIPLSENPIAKLKLKTDDKKRNRRLNAGEEEALLSVAIKAKPGYLHSIVKLAIETAMRRGEILAINRQHINFHKNLLEIPVTKNGEARTIPLTQKAVSILTDAIQREVVEGQRLFSVSENALRHSWSRACRKAKIHDLHFHDLRHEAISRFFEMGLTTPEVALISGHKDIRMLFRYAHATQKSILGKFKNISETT